MYYFAYGSNMFSARMKQRVASADDGRLAFVDGYVLRFHKIGRSDRSGKCDGYCTGCVDDRLFGVLYEMDEADLPGLDRVEGLGKGYNRIEAPVQIPNSDAVSAWMYVADPGHIDPSLRPAHWYVKYVLDGALEHRLPHDYILRSISSAFTFMEP